MHVAAWCGMWPGSVCVTVRVCGSACGCVGGLCRFGSVSQLNHIGKPRADVGQEQHYSQVVNANFFLFGLWVHTFVFALLQKLLASLDQPFLHPLKLKGISGRSHQH